MTLTLDLPPDVQEAITKAAQEQGKSPEQEAVESLRRLYVRQAPSPQAPALPVVDPTLALFAQWAEEDATDDPAELERRNQEWSETKASLEANRLRLRDVSHLVDEETV